MSGHSVGDIRITTPRKNGEKIIEAEYSYHRRYGKRKGRD